MRRGEAEARRAAETSCVWGARVLPETGHRCQDRRPTDMAGDPAAPMLPDLQEDSAEMWAGDAFAPLEHPA